MVFTNRFLKGVMILSVLAVFLGGCQYIEELYGSEDGVSYVPLGDVPVEGEEPVIVEITEEELAETEDEITEVIEIIEDVESSEVPEEEIEIVEEAAEDVSEVVEIIEEVEESKAIVIIVSETEPVSLVAKADDPDADKLSYTFTSPLDNEGKWSTGYGDAGEYTITVTVSDGELSSSRDVLLIVNKKEEAPRIDSFNPIGSAIDLKETESVEFSVSASDLNGDELNYNWKLDGNDVSSSESFGYNTGYDDSGSHTINIDVSDGAASATHTWSVNVQNVNRKPVLTGIGDVTVKETETVTISPQATDEDGDEIAFKVGEPVGDDGVWQTTYDDAGEYTVKVTANDGTDEASQDVRVIVENVNRKPVILDIIKG